MFGINIYLIYFFSLCFKSKGIALFIITLQTWSLLNSALFGVLCQCKRYFFASKKKWLITKKIKKKKKKKKDSYQSFLCKGLKIVTVVKREVSKQDRVEFLSFLEEPVKAKEDRFAVVYRQVCSRKTSICLAWVCIAPEFACIG